MPRWRLRFNTLSSVPVAPSPILIDALNVAYWCGEAPSLRLPMSLMAHLLGNDFQVLMYFDASARHRVYAEADMYQRLLQHPQQIIEVPSGRTADQAMLRRATSTGARILSRDLYRDYRKRHRKLIDDPTRLISGTIEQERLQIPSLALDAPLHGSTLEAWEQLEPLLLRELSPRLSRTA